MKYVKKPIAIEAHQWWKNGDHPQDECVMLKNQWGCGFLSEGRIVSRYRTPDDNGSRPCANCGNLTHLHGWVQTLEGGHIVCPGDWIITGVRGEHYPIKASIFAETYEPASEEGR